MAKLDNGRKKVGVSACLLGEACRYDGRSKPCAMVRDVLSRLVDFVPICPECECGLGCPRVAMDLYRDEGGDEIRMMAKDGVEHGLQMREWIVRKLPELKDLAGFVLKARSPSCGIGDAKLNGGPECTDGLFAAALRKAYPLMVLRNEESFATEADCAAFVKQLEDVALLQRVEACVRDLLANSPACHDWDHTLRVWNNAKRIAAMTKAAHPDAPLDETLVSVAALMHDIGRPQELADQGKTNHAVYGAELCLKLLPELGVNDASYCARVADCIRSHRFRKREGNAEPASLEAKIVYDADKLDSIGAIGIGRSFHFAGRTGARVHNRAEEALASDSYSREDSAYREYLVKLRKIRERMLTDAGRQLAEKRHAFMVVFFEELNEECFGGTE